MSSLEKNYVLDQVQIAFLVTDTLASIAVIIPVAYQNIIIERLLQEQMIQNEKIQVEVTNKTEFLRKVCHVSVKITD